eukprot:COSAG04_NODE_407_length_14863_cov_24.011244_11_plen_608_part_00
MIEEETCFGEQGGATHPMAEEVDYVVMLAGMGSSAANDAGGIRARPVEQMGHVGATSNHVAMAETGDVSLTADWLTVSLNNYYFKPVVIAGSPTANGGDTATVRVRNVRHGQGCAGWCFDIKIQEPPCLDGPHPNAETVNWMVIESGSWATEGCQGCSNDEAHMLQAGVVEVEGDMRMTGQMFHEVEFYGSGFPTPSWSYAPGKGGPTLPVVVTHVNSYLGGDWVKTRQQQKDNLGFLVALEEVGSFGNSMNAHTNFEKVGWMATEVGIGNFGVRNYMAGLTGQSVTNEDYHIDFWVPFVGTPRFFATMQTYAGTDSSQLRARSVDNDGATVFVEEEGCSDDELDHVEEIVGYIALDSASNGVSDEYDQMVHARSNLDRGCEALYDATSADLRGAILTETAGGGDYFGGGHGSGGIDFQNADGDTATWNVNGCRSGHYYVIFGYALAGGADRPMSVTVNEEVVDGYMSFPSTGSWSTWSEVRVPVKLDPGQNTIVLSAIGFSGPSIDYMAVSPIGPVGYGETTTIGEGGRQRTIDYRLTASGLTGQTVDPEEQWLTVHMGGSYTDPVVIVGPPSELGGQEAVARIKGLRYQAAGTAHTQYSAGTMVK